MTTFRLIRFCHEDFSDVKPENLITRFRAGGHRIAIGITDDGRNAMRVERHVDDDGRTGRTWIFDDYNRARAVAEWLRDLSDYQRDALILKVQP